MAERTGAADHASSEARPRVPIEKEEAVPVPPGVDLTPLRVAWAACLKDTRTRRGLELWAKTTQGSTRGPLMDLLKALQALC